MLRTGIETIICLSPNFLYVYVYVYVYVDMQHATSRLQRASVAVRSSAWSSSGLPADCAVCCAVVRSCGLVLVRPVRCGPVGPVWSGGVFSQTERLRLIEWLPQ